jgi:hypothetical protein
MKSGLVLNFHGVQVLEGEGEALHMLYSLHSEEPFGHYLGICSSIHVHFVV